jgi:hypothetical protein
MRRSFRGVLERKCNNTPIDLTHRGDYGLCMDKLDQLIAEKVAEIDGLAIKRQYALIELEALKRAALARPVGALTAEPKPKVTPVAVKTKPHSARNGKNKGGRQAGDISREWRKALALLHHYGKRASYLDIQSVAAKVDIKSQLPNVRERVRTMIENGLMKGDSDGGFSVTSAAVTRFELDKLIRQMQPSAELPFNEIGPR